MIRNKQCQVCKKDFSCKKDSRRYCSNSCKAKLYKQENTDKELERHRDYYWLQKEVNYKNLRAINMRAFYKKRFGVLDKNIIFKRDKYKCKNCGSDKRLLIHHIDKNGRGNSNPNNDPKNLITLCASCHALHHLHNRKLKI